MILGKKGAIRWLHSCMYTARKPEDRLHAAGALDAMRGIRPAGPDTTAWLGAKYEAAHWADKLALEVVIRCVLEARRV